MSQADALRMTAEVQDKFTGPLGALKKQLADLAAAGTGHTDTLEKGFGKLTGGMKAAETAAASGLNPALRSVGITSLTVSAAVLGVGAALKSFASGAASIGQLSRDTNIGAQQLREVQGVLGKVGVDAATSGQALQQFAESARLARNGVGPIIEFLTRQGRSPEGRAYFQNLAKDIRQSKDAGEALDKALKGMEGIKDPVERRLYAENVLKMGDAARLVGGPLGTLQQQIAKFRATNGILTPKDIEAAERYQRALGDLGSSMSKLGTVIAIELAGPAEQVATALAAIVSNERGGAIQAIREGLRDVKTELGKIDWSAASKDGLVFLREGTALATSLARALHETAESIRYIRNGEKVQALRGLDGASGPLARKLAPRVGDDEIAATEEVERLTKLRDLAREAQQHFIGRTQQRMGLLDSPEEAQRRLDAADARLEALQNRTSKQREQDFKDSQDKLRQSMDKLGDKIDSERGANGAQGGSAADALLHLQSYGGGTGIGALIQKAAYSGARGGGGYGGGTLGERLFGQPTGSNALGDSGRESRMQAMLADPMTEWRMRIARGERGVPMPGSGSGAAETGRAMRGGGRRFAGSLDLRDADPQVVAYIKEQAAKRGIDPNTALAVSDGEGLRGFGPNKPVAGDGGTSHGPFQMHYAGGRGGNRQRGLGDDFTRDTGLDARDPSTWKRQIEYSLDHAAKNGWKAWYGRQHHGVGIWDGIGGRPGVAFGDDGDASGLRLKSREATAGGPSATGLTSFFRDLQGSNLPGGFDRVTALNDAYHHRANPGSMHTRGLAGDVTLRDPRYSAQAAEAIRERLRAAGLDPSSYKVMDEYRNPSGHATGGHLHVQFSDREAADRYRAYTEAAQRKQVAEVGDGIKQVRPWQKAPADGGAAFAADFKRRQAEEDDRRSGLKLSTGAQSALQAGAGGQKVEADGKVHINIEQPGPNTKVRSSASGNLFREVVQSRGRQMQPAGDP